MKHLQETLTEARKFYYDIEVKEGKFVAARKTAEKFVVSTDTVRAWKKKGFHWR